MLQQDSGCNIRSKPSTAGNDRRPIPVELTEPVSQLVEWNVSRMFGGRKCTFGNFGVRAYIDYLEWRKVVAGIHKRRKSVQVILCGKRGHVQRIFG